MAIVRYERSLSEAVVAFSSDAALDFLKGEDSPSGMFQMTPAQRAMVLAAGVKEDMIFPKQVHGDVIWEVSPGDVRRCGVVEADAVVVPVPGVAIAVRTADCLPLLLFAPDRRVIAAVHAGWKSTRLDIAAKTVRLLKTRYGVDPAEIRGAIGPCIRPQSYPVGEDFRAIFPAEVQQRRGCLCFDIAAANRRQLVAEGVRGENITDCGIDTFADRQWHSFRRDGEASGRMIHVIMLKG
jgi:YfiH family protein